MSDPHHAPDPRASAPEAEQTASPPPKKRLSKRFIFFGSCAVIAIIVYCIANAGSFVSLFGLLGDVLSPIFIGGIIAYLCNPFLKFYEYVIFRRMGKSGLRRGLSLLCTVLTALGIIAAVLALILPELIDSLTQLVTNADYYLSGVLAFVQRIINAVTANFDVEIDISDVEKLTAFIEDAFGSMEEFGNEMLTKLQQWVLNDNFLAEVWAAFKDVFNSVKNIVLGIFIAFYILSSKEKRVAQINKFRAAYFSEKQNARIGEVVTLVDRTFGGFIKGLLLDALAVGVVTFLLLSIFRVSEYNLLIAAICAVTNIIPVFGPFIGAIPSALIVLISSPEKLLLFIILVVVIQQIDGNILCPLIQGSNTGVSSLAVLIAITVMGGLFGIGGMIIGVPVFAVFIELVKRAIEARLTRRGRPTDTTFYYPANAVGNAEEDVYYEHSHLRYMYDHSKLKVYVDRALAALGRLRKNKKQKPEKTKPDKAKSDKAKSKKAGKRTGNKKK